MARRFRAILLRVDRTYQSCGPLVTLLGVLMAGPVFADGPEKLQWWSGREAGGIVRGEGRGEGDAVGPIAPPLTPLEHWQAKQRAEALGWWLVPRPGVEFEERLEEREFAEQFELPIRRTAAQQGALSPPMPTPPTTPPRNEPLPPPARPQPALPAQPAPTMPEESPHRDPSETRDPFARIPVERLRPLSEVRVALDTPTHGLVEEGRAEELFAEHGTFHLAIARYPSQTPEAAAYQFFSRPLWYEDPNLERCGYTVGCCQPLVSGAYFFGNTFWIPYRLVAEPQCVTVPARPFCPPGCRYTHAQNYLPEPNAAGAVAQAAAVTGLFFLIP